MTLSGNGWGAGSENDFSTASQTTTDEYNFTHDNKPTKAIIGVGILVVAAIALAFFEPIHRGEPSSTSPSAIGRFATSDVNHAPAQTTGSAPTTAPTPTR